MKLTLASPEAIRYACQNFHYSGSVPIVTYGFNVFNDAGQWCGVICFGPGACPHAGTPFGLCHGEILELVRVALNGKQETTSQAMAMAMHELHRRNPLVKLVVSYADMDQGHIGTIYQATNWIYLGAVNVGARGAFLIDGKKVHPKTCHIRGWKQSLPWIRENVDPDALEIKTKGKHKYIFCFDKKQRKKFEKSAKPYPKKEGIA